MGVIGSAASCVQFLPTVAAQSGEVVVHQRTAQWVTPKDDTVPHPLPAVAFAKLTNRRYMCIHAG